MRIYVNKYNEREYIQRDIDWIQNHNAIIMNEKSSACEIDLLSSSKKNILYSKIQRLCKQITL